ncbi:MlaD family protein [Rhodoferax sp.]|uniref:MlaD family protein n=1 Tax=Rhodoferax sp. TaxID=50421 RepID=UPI002768C491|nr:MlaD family protein [Rhodoferax sp.]
MENKAHAIAAGAFVLMVSALLVALAVWLTRDTGTQRLFELSTRDAVNGLQPQAPVRFRGVLVGKVTHIGFDPLTPGNVLVRISVDERAPVSRSTYGSLGFQGVTGLAFVQLDDSGESQEALTSKDEHPPRIPMRAGLLSKLSDQGVSILAELEETSRRVNLLLAPENQKKLMGSIDNLGKAASGIEQFSLNANRVLGAQLDPERLNLPLLVANANEALATLKDSSERVASSADAAKASANEFKRMNERLNQPGGTLDKLAEGVDALSATGQNINALTLPRLNRTMDATARAVRQVGRAVNDVAEQPNSLLFGNGPIPPGPGEAGHAAPGAKP